MRNLFLITFVLLGGISAFAQKSAPTKMIAPIVRETPLEREKFDPTRNAANDLQTAIITATKANKRIILDVGGEWCGWCQHMDAVIAKNPELKKLHDENYVWLKINMSEANENKDFLAKYPEIKGYPHLFVLEKDGTLLKSKDTSELEAGETYDLQKFTDFLKEYAPAKIAQTK